MTTANRCMRVAWYYAADELRHDECLAAPIPYSMQVLAIARRLGIVASQNDVRDWCRDHKMALADSHT